MARQPTSHREQKPLQFWPRCGLRPCGLSHFARRCPRTGPVSRGARSGTHLHHQVSVPLGSSTRSAPKTPPSPALMNEPRKDLNRPGAHRCGASPPPLASFYSTVRWDARVLGEVAEHLPKHEQVDTASTCSSKWPGLVWRMTAAMGDTAHLTGRVSPRRQPSNSFTPSSRRISSTISTPLCPSWFMRADEMGTCRMPTLSASSIRQAYTILPTLAQTQAVKHIGQGSQVE